MLSNVIYLCNALDEETKNVRRITTDSPAATKKVFGLCQALKISDVIPIVLSMGRGRQNGSGHKFLSAKKHIDGIQVHYAFFLHLPILTHIVTAWSLMMGMCVLLKTEHAAVLAYNRVWHYIPALIVAKLVRIPCFLDLEDGWGEKQTYSQIVLTKLFDWFCNAGSLLACDKLSDQVKTINNMSCYGAVDAVKTVERKWQGESLQVLFGGSLSEGTGAKMFMQALDIFYKKHQDQAKIMRFIVVGFGDMAEELSVYALNKTELVEFRGSVSNSEYNQLLADSHIGLCLKQSTGEYNDSTFPSKVIELSSHGLMLVSTPVSDVPRIFGSKNALLLPSDSPEALADALFWLAMHPDELFIKALNGQSMILDRFSIKAVGAQLKKFFLDNKNEVI